MADNPINYREERYPTVELIARTALQMAAQRAVSAGASHLRSQHTHLHGHLPPVNEHMPLHVRRPRAPQQPFKPVVLGPDMPKKALKSTIDKQVAREAMSLQERLGLKLPRVVNEAVSAVSLATHDAKPPAPRKIPPIIPLDEHGKPVPVIRTTVHNLEPDPTMADMLVLPGSEDEMIRRGGGDHITRAYRGDFERTPLIRKTLVHDNISTHWRDILTAPQPPAVATGIDMLVKKFAPAAVRDPVQEATLVRRHQNINRVLPMSPAMVESIRKANNTWAKELTEYIMGLAGNVPA